MKLAAARYNVGQIVYDKDSDHRGVVCDVDMEHTHPRQQARRDKQDKQSDEPRYHVLMDGCDIKSYVGQSQLTASTDVAPINHPLVLEYFKRFEDGSYRFAPLLN